MLEKLKSKIILNKILGRPNIDNAYALTDPSDSWYPTLKKVHESLAEIQTRPHSTLEVTSSDGLTLRAIHYPCEQANKGTVLFIHGYTSHAEREWAFPALFYLNLGYNVVIPYQRAHGLSDGKYITWGIKEKQDMLLWLDKADQLHPNLPVIIHGLSMGGGIALQLCDIDNANVKCIVADAPSEGIRHLFHSVSQQVSRNPDKQYRALCKTFAKIAGDVAQTDVQQYVQKSNYPIFFVAGSQENAQSRLEKLAEICPKPTTVVILPGCNHGNGMYKQTDMFQTELKKFFETYVK